MPCGFCQYVSISLMVTYDQVPNLMGDYCCKRLINIDKKKLNWVYYVWFVLEFSWKRSGLLYFWGSKSGCYFQNICFYGFVFKIF